MPHEISYQENAPIPPQDLNFARQVGKFVGSLLHTPIPNRTISTWSHLNHMIRTIDNLYDTSPSDNDRQKIIHQTLDFLGNLPSPYPFPAAADSANFVKHELWQQGEINVARFTKQVETVFQQTQKLRSQTSRIAFAQDTYLDGANTAILFPEFLPPEFWTKPGFQYVSNALIAIGGIYKNLDTLKDHSSDFHNQETPVPPNIISESCLAVGIITHFIEASGNALISQVVWASSSLPFPN